MATKRTYKQFLDPSLSSRNVSWWTNNRWQQKKQKNCSVPTDTETSIVGDVDFRCCDGINITTTFDNEDNNQGQENEFEELFPLNDTGEDQDADENEDEPKINGNQHQQYSDFNTFEQDYSDIMFESSNLAVKDVIFMIQAFSFRWKLPYKGRNALFEMVKVLAGSKFDSLQISNYYFSKRFDPPEKCVNYNFYCSSGECSNSLSKPMTKKELQKATQITKCSNCEKEYTLSLKSTNYFTSIDVEYQINVLLQNKTLKTSLLETVDNIKRKTGTDNGYSLIVSDVYDGKLYNHLNKNDTEKSHYLTYNFSTDGAPIFKSSKRSMWPLQITLNEFPPHLRFQNIILAGLWVCNTEPKPNQMNLYISSLFEQTEKLRITVITDTGIIKCFKLIPLCAVTDTVARPILQNRIQFNGYMGCSWCYHNGEYLNGAMRYPLQENDAAIRTHGEHLRDIRESLKSKKPVRGVKGKTALNNIPSFDVVWGCPVEYMHGVVLGVTKQLLELWLRPGFPFSLNKCARNEIDSRLEIIQPPHEIHRLPRKLSERPKWKASEWKAWLLFYSIPILTGIANMEVINHLALLVKSIYTLLKTEVSLNELNECEIDLLEFVGQFQILYGNGNVTFNLHSLLHLVDSVKYSGPLWATSAFPYESLMFVLKEQINGPKGVDQQITKRLLQINQLKQTLFTSNNTSTDKNNSSAITDYCLSLFTKTNINYFTKSEDEPKLLGKGKLPLEREMAINQKIFVRCVFNKHIYHSAEYTSSHKNNDSVVELKNGKIVQIMKFISEETFIVPVCNIKEKLVFLNLNQDYYVCKFPNLFETQ